MAGNVKMWTIGRGFWLWIPPKSQIWSFGQPQNGERVTWSWEDNKSRAIATVSDEVEESLQVFLPKKKFATPIWFAHNCLSHWRDVKPLQYKFGLHTIPYHIEEMQNLCNINLVCTQLLIKLKKCKTFATSSGLQMPNFFLIFSFAFSASGIPSLGVVRQGWAKSRDCDCDWTTSSHRHRDHISQDYGNDRTYLIRLVSTKFGQTHWTITPVLAKLILFWDEVVKQYEGKWGFQYIPWLAKCVNSCCLFLWDCVMATKIRQDSPLGFE